jgi:hypothetical protein
MGLGVASLLRHAAPRPAGEHTLHDRYSLLFQLATLLLGLNVVSWPLFYLLLRSYVPEWPGVMCIYGVPQIGSGGEGASGFLPSLLAALQVLKPAVVFLSGAWFVLHLVNRGTRTAPLTRRFLFVLAALGLLATVDAALEGAYLAIPKKEELPPAGCCAEVFSDAAHASRLVPGALLEERSRPPLLAAFYAANVGMTLGLLALLRARLRGARAWAAVLLLGALAALLVSAAFLVEVGAPALLGPRQGRSLAFCCVGCAESWLGRSGASPRAIYVTDEATGREIDAARAFYVRSLVVTTATKGDRVHAFERRADAEAHAAAYRGRLLTGPERPFSTAITGPDSTGRGQERSEE